MVRSQDTLWAPASRLLHARSDGWHLLLSEALTPDISESCRWGLLLFFFFPFLFFKIITLFLPTSLPLFPGQALGARRLQPSPEMFVCSKEKALQRFGSNAHTRPLSQPP